MATLREYFAKDARTLTIHQTITIRDDAAMPLLDAIGRLHLDLETNAKYVSFYIPSTDKVECPARMLLNTVDEICQWTTTSVGVSMGFKNTMYANGADLKFSGRVFLYSEDAISEENKRYILTRSRELGQFVVIRDQQYVTDRNEAEVPLAFISHDSRDKKAIAEPLALEFARLTCPVWFDEFSLKVGDSLRESIKKGIRECKKCIFVLTPNFLANGGWARREYDSVFTRELVENQKVILPIWSGVSRKEIYDFSPTLADRVALNWDQGVENVARKLLSAISN